jgi:tetratricopeptide (TPR) repeat protein
MANGLQQKPKDSKQLHDAICLYQQAIELSSQNDPLLQGRALAGMATALRAMPGEGADLLLEAKKAYETALQILREQGEPAEVGEAEMNLGLVLQALVGFNLATMKQAIETYQRALPIFTADKHPQEYAILHNNIAIAYLSMTLSPEREGMRQAMAVQSFEEALKAVNLIEHPNEYAMLHNNLANALQYLPSLHPVDNNLRALTAYNEALKVRTAQDTPLEYAATISNKANLLYNLPDNPKYPEAGNYQNLLRAKKLYEEAHTIFCQYSEVERATVVSEALSAVEAELLLFELDTKIPTT